MLVTFSVVDKSSKFIYNRSITFASEENSIKEFLVKKNVNIEDIIDIKIGTSIQASTSTDLFSIDEIKIHDLSVYKPCFIHVIVR